MQSSAASFSLGALLGAVLGLAAAWTLLSDHPRPSVRPPEPGGSPAAATEARADGVPLVGLAPTATTGRAPAPKSSPPAPAAVPPAHVEELVREARPAPAERAAGEGELQGTVVDERGRGLEGVVLRARSEAPRDGSVRSGARIGQGPPPLPALDDVVRDTVQEWSERRARTFEAVTDARGRYLFAGLPEGALSVAAYKEGFVLESDDDPRRTAAGRRVDWVARAVLSVRVDVFSPDGTRASEALVEVDALRADGRTRTRQLGWTAAEPVLFLEPVPAELRALAEPLALDARGGPEFALASERVAVEPPLAGGAAPPVRLDLFPRPGVRGRVVRPGDGLRGDSPVVYLQRLASGAEPNLRELERANENQGVRGGDEYAFLDLAPGRYAVGASRAWGSAIAAHGVVEVATDVVELDLVLPPVDVGRMITARVVGPAGESLDDVEFRFLQASERSHDSSGLRELRTEQGLYLLDVPARARAGYFGEAEPGTTYALVAMSAGHGQTQVPLAPGQTRAEVTFAAPARLEVTILGYADSGYEGRLTVSLESTDGSNTRRSDAPNAAGVALLAALAPGAYRAALTLEDEDRGSGRRIARTELELSPGPNTARLAIPPLYSVRVHAPDHEPGTSLRAYSVGERGSSYGSTRISATLDGDRRAVLADLVAGRYRLQARGERRVELEIDVPCGEVLLEDRPIDALRVRILDPEGLLARAGLREGDLVTGVDGREFEGERDLARAFAPRSGAVRLTLSRRGRSRDIEVPADALRGAGGGRLEPARR